MAAVKNFCSVSNLAGKCVILSGKLTNLSCNHVIHRGSKHWNPKWKWHRTQKVIKVELPNFHEKEEDKMSVEEMRSKMKERGIAPPRFWEERPFFISSTGGIFEPYIPPEGDGKVSFISKEGAKQKYHLLEKKGKSMMAIRKIRTYDEDFETDEFLNIAQEVYIKAHHALKTKNPEDLLPYVTERGIPEMLNNVKNKTIKWDFIKSIEPPRIVHARYTDVITKTNIFAQLTVRFHSQQMLAIYDRFGRLFYGSDIVAKDVLEYIVFEKHVSNVYGKWRLHDKIIPEWMPVPSPPPKTYREQPLPTEEDVETATTEVVAKEGEAKNESTPALTS